MRYNKASRWYKGEFVVYGYLRVHAPDLKVREQEYGAKSGVDRPFTQIKIAELRNDAGIIGAAALR